QRGDRRVEPPAGIDERLEGAVLEQRLDADGSDLADLRSRRRQSGRLEVDDDESRRLERQAVTRRRGQRDEIAAPRQPRVGANGLLEQRARERDRRAPEREQLPGGLLGGDRPAPLLDELDQAIRGVETQLHGSQPIRTYVRKAREG